MTVFDNGETVTWHRWIPGGTDDYGKPLPGTYVEQDLTGVAFAPEGTDESEPDGRTVIDAEIIVRGSAIPYSARDQFTARGVRYGVEGASAGGWRNPFTGWTPGQTIKLKRVVG